MEAMEEDTLEPKDDHNHNSFNHQLHGADREQPGPEPRPEPGPGPGLVDSDSGSDSEVSDEAAPGNSGTFSFDGGSKFLMSSFAIDDYQKNHWPNLEKAIDRLLIHNSTDHISVSYAQIYSYVYKCVCQQHSELLYRDMTHKITAHLQHVCDRLQSSAPEVLIEDFNAALSQYVTSLQCIVPVFMYLNKFYVESKLNRDLKQELMELFAEVVAEKHIHTLMPLLVTAHTKPFQVQPSTMASVVTGLYALRPDWAQMAPALFSAFIPQIHPPTKESLLPDYAARDQQLQMELSRNGFPRGDRSRKRASEDS